MVLWLLHKVTKRRDRWKFIKVGYWDMWRDSSGRSCRCHTKTLKENKGVTHAGPWEGPLTLFGARSHQMQSLFQAGSKDHHSISKW
eukprot:11995589-Prorocentrum_lima.AAC.1